MEPVGPVAKGEEAVKEEPVKERARADSMVGMEEMVVRGGWGDMEEAEFRTEWSVEWRQKCRKERGWKLVMGMAAEKVMNWKVVQKQEPN